jgi:hypothetical protein
MQLNSGDEMTHWLERVQPVYGQFAYLEGFKIQSDKFALNQY